MEATQAGSVENKQSLGLIEQIMVQTRMKPGEGEYSIAKKGVAEFISAMIKTNDTVEPINKRLVDQMIAEIDSKMGKQTDAILHNKDVQNLEAAWKGLKILIDRTDFRENIKIEMIHVTKEELLDDFDFSPEVTQSGLYKHVYSSGYGQFGGEPVGAVIANYTFGPSSPDIKLLNYAAAVGAMAHAPFISAAGCEFLNIDSYTELPNLKDI